MFSLIYLCFIILFLIQNVKNDENNAILGCGFVDPFIEQNNTARQNVNQKHLN
jgi:hypothetical protein